jgi:hypothetical protein
MNQAITRESVIAQFTQRAAELDATVASLAGVDMQGIEWVVQSSAGLYLAPIGGGRFQPGAVERAQVCRLAEAKRLCRTLQASDAASIAAGVRLVPLAYVDALKLEADELRRLAAQLAGA